MVEEGHTLHELERRTGEDLASSDYWAQARAGVITNWIGRLEPESVLDIGCGSGYLTARIAKELPDAEVIGVDYNETSIRMAKRRATTANFQVADAWNLPFDPDHFDVLVFGDIIEHFDTPEDLLWEAQSVLKPDGDVIVSVPAFRWLMGPHDDANKHADRYTKNRLKYVGWKAGLGMVGARYTNFFPLVPYYLFQRVLQREVPKSTRGGHNSAIEFLKWILLAYEVVVPWPVGVSLIARFELHKGANDRPEVADE